MIRKILCKLGFHVFPYRPKTNNVLLQCDYKYCVWCYKQVRCKESKPKKGVARVMEVGLTADYIMKTKNDRN